MLELIETIHETPCFLVRLRSQVRYGRKLQEARYTEQNLELN